jgi:preprotein translocase subunit SecG
MRRSATSLLLAVLLLALSAPAALAHNDGRGFYGATDDKVVTAAGLSLVVFFPLLALVLTLIQSRLDKRKEARKAAQKAHGFDERWRGGW